MFQISVQGVTLRLPYADPRLGWELSVRHPEGGTSWVALTDEQARALVRIIAPAVVAVLAAPAEP